MTDPTPSAVPEPDGPPPVPGVDIFDADEVPAPAVAAAASGPVLAHPAQRAVAFALDGLGTVIVTTIVVFAGLGADYGFAFAAILGVPVLSAALSTVLTAVFGVTPAKALLGITVVDVDSGRPIGWRSLLRSLVIVAPLALAFLLTWALAYSAVDVWLGYTQYVPIVCWIGMLVVLAVRPRHRGLQDLAARSIVVRR